MVNYVIYFSSVKYKTVIENLDLKLRLSDFDLYLTVIAGRDARLSVTRATSVPYRN